MTDTLTPPEPDISPVTIEEEMKRSYLEYAMSVIVARALPDARDGLKPVHRRILYGMHEASYDWTHPHRKSARVVGDVMGKYHPHGDQAIYDALVRMAQDFSMRLPLIDGQGNFGSMDGDPPAAMRYTEVRLARSAGALLEDIDKNTVDFQSNYDDSSREPAVLPARFPNLLVNGAGGIAVGMATNIPPHNLGEVIDACCAYIDDPAISVDTLIAHIPAPDFPTGGLILGAAGAREAYRTGRGQVMMRGRVHIEPAARDRQAIVATEIPYQVNKSRMIEQIAEVARSKRIEGIAELRDESDRDGVRVVVEVKRDANVDVVLNQLYRYTPLQTSFGLNMLALRGGRPVVLGLKDIIAIFVDHREEVIKRRTEFELAKARERAEVLVGLAIAVANIDAVISLVRKARDPATAREQLMAATWPATDVAALIALIDRAGEETDERTYKLSEMQARAILELRLQRLTALERDKVGAELRETAEKIIGYLETLRNRSRLFGILRDELIEIKERFATPRRTTIVEGDYAQDDEDLIQREDMVVTVSHSGYIKRVPLSTYRSQRRGGKGRAGMSTREEDFVSRVFIVNTHTPVLFFSTAGRVSKLKTYELPPGTPLTRGKAMINLLPLAVGETIATLMPFSEDEEAAKDLSIMFATAGGTVRRNALDDFSSVMANGKIAMKLAPGDSIVGVQTCGATEDVLLASRGGKCIRFPVGGVRVFRGRTSHGVRGIKLAKGDQVISMSILRHVEIDVGERAAYFKRRRQDGSDGEAQAITAGRVAELEPLEEFILTVTENGFGKRTSAYDYRITGRGGQGIINIETSERNGRVVASFPVADGDQVMLVTDHGQLIRSPVGDIRVAGRNTQGVTLFRTGEGERVVSVAALPDGVADEQNEAELSDADGHAPSDSDGSIAAAAEEEEE